MKSAVFARPNLKAFLLGAILIAVVQDVISRAQSQGSFLSNSTPNNAYVLSETELQLLIEQAKKSPGSQVFMRLSRCYEKRGDIKKALLYLHRAEKFAQAEEAED